MMTWQYHMDDESRQRIQLLLRKLGASFVPREEKQLNFASSVMILEGTFVITEITAVQRLPVKAWDLVARFAAVKEFMSTVPMVQIGEDLPMQEVREIFYPSVHHLPYNVQPAPKMHINLGQLDHMGDPEILLMPKIFPQLINMEFKIINSRAGKL